MLAGLALSGIAMRVATVATSPAKGHMLHCPPYQWCTAAYQSVVVGRKKKPSAGHTGAENTPASHDVKNHSPAMTRRGKASARTTAKQGMAGIQDEREPMSRVVAKTMDLDRTDR